MAEGILNHYGKGSYRALSAGSHPTGKVHALSLATLKAHGMKTEGYRSKSWDELAQQPIDIVITVCDDAAGESCPLFPGGPVKAHWGVPDPARLQGTPGEIEEGFDRVFAVLARRIQALLALPENMDQATLAASLNQISALQ